MRFYEKTKMVLSEDVSNDPKLIKFSDEFEDIELTLLTKVVEGVRNFATGTTSVMVVTVPKLLWMRPDADIGIKLDGGATIPIRGAKSLKLWATFTTLDIVVAGATPIEVAFLTAGE